MMTKHLKRFSTSLQQIFFVIFFLPKTLRHRQKHSNYNISVCIICPQSVYQLFHRHSDHVFPQNSISLSFHSIEIYFTFFCVHQHIQIHVCVCVHLFLNMYKKCGEYLMILFVERTQHSRIQFSQQKQTNFLQSNKKLFTFGFLVFPIFFEGIENR